MGLTSIRLSEVRKVAMSRPGMWQEFIAAGKVAGEYLQIDRAEFDQLQAKWFPGGFGTAVHNAIAGAVKLADRALGTNLENCGGCAEREMKLNAATATKP